MRRLALAFPTLLGLAIPAVAAFGIFQTYSISAPTTLNPSDKAAIVTLSDGNLTMTNSSSGPGSVRSVASYSTGLKYYEATFGTGASAYDHGVAIGNASASLTSPLGSVDANSIAYYNGDANVYGAGGGLGSSGLVSASGDVVSVAIDLDNNAIWIRVNCGNWNSSGAANPSTNTGGIGGISGVAKPWYAMGYGGANSVVTTFNFGATAYACTPPAGATNW